jgi:hypothetical protein
MIFVPFRTLIFVPPGTKGYEMLYESIFVPHFRTHLAILSKTIFVPFRTPFSYPPDASISVHYRKQEDKQWQSTLAIEL